MIHCGGSHSGSTGGTKIRRIEIMFSLQINGSISPFPGSPKYHGATTAAAPHRGGPQGATAALLCTRFVTNIPNHPVCMWTGETGIPGPNSARRNLWTGGIVNETYPTRKSNHLNRHGIRARNATTMWSKGSFRLVLSLYSEYRVGTRKASSAIRLA